MASTINLVADSLVIDGDADSSSSATSINGVEIKNMKLGEKDQPLYVYTSGFEGDYQLDGNRPGFNQPGADYMGRHHRTGTIDQGSRSGTLRR